VFFIVFQKFHYVAKHAIRAPWLHV